MDPTELGDVLTRRLLEHSAASALFRLNKLETGHVSDPTVFSPLTTVSDQGSASQCDSAIDFRLSRSGRTVARLAVAARRLSPP